MLDTRPFEGWPSRNCRPIMKLIFEPSELERKYNLQFIREKDDLDWLVASHFYDNEIGPVVLLRHDGSPEKGTPIYVDAALDIQVAIKRLIQVLNLSENVINWSLLDDK